MKKVFTKIVIMLAFVFIGWSATNAQIVYTDIIPDTTIMTNNAVYHLDLNHDGITDFDIKFTNTSHPSTYCGALTNTNITITSLDSNEVLSNTSNVPLALAINSMIDANALNWSYTTPQNLYAATRTCVGNLSIHYVTTTYGGPFYNAADKYVGLKFHFGGNNYYGWVRLTNSGNSSMTIEDYAYDSNPNEAIITGMTNLPYAAFIATNYCMNDSIAIPYFANNNYGAGNYFILQLSDSAGTFNNPTILDSIQSTVSGTFHTVIPPGLIPSVHYRLRIVSTISSFIGPSTNAFTINIPPPVPMLSNLGDTVCPGTILQATISGPCIGCSYQWQFNGTNITNATGTSTHIDSSGRYNVVITNLCGVSISTIDTFFVMPVITVTIPASMIVCLNNLPMQLNVATPTGGTYHGTGITGIDMFNVSNPGNDTITYTVNDAFGCSFSSTRMVIHVPAVPVPTITLTGDTLHSSLALHYQWYFNNNIMNNDTNRIVVITQNGSYTVAVTDSNGCTNTSNVFVTALGPFAALTATNYCINDSIAIPYSAMNNYGVGNYFIAQLSDSAGTFNNPTILDSIQSTVSDTFHTIIPLGLIPSVHYRLRIVSTISILIGPSTNAFTINRPPPVPMLSNLNDTVCPGVAILHSTITGACLGCGYQWQFNGTNIPNATGTSTPIDSSGRYNVVITNLCGVSISTIDTFFVMPVINVTIPASMNVCLNNLPMQLNVATPAGGTYHGIGITGINTFSVSNPGNDTITYTINDAFGCTFSSTKMIIHVNTCAGVSEISTINTIDIFPNPATTFLNIHQTYSTQSTNQLIITDLMGNEVYKEKLTGIDNTISISTWNAGIYFYEVRGDGITNSAQQSVRGKFVVQK